MGTRRPTFHLEPDQGHATGVGDVDTYSVDTFVAWLDRVRAGGHRDLHLDVADLRFTDADGLRALVDQAQRFRAAGGRLRLVNVAAPLQRLLEAARLGDGLEIVGNGDGARHSPGAGVQ